MGVLLYSIKKLKKISSQKDRNESYLEETGKTSTKILPVVIFGVIFG